MTNGLLQRSYRVDGAFLPKCARAPYRSGPLVQRYFFTIRRGRDLIEDLRAGACPILRQHFITPSTPIQELRKKNDCTDPTLTMVVQDQAGQDSFILAVFSWLLKPTAPNRRGNRTPSEELATKSTGLPWNLGSAFLLATVCGKPSSAARQGTTDPRDILANGARFDLGRYKPGS